MEFIIGGKAWGKSSGRRSLIKKSFVCGCMTDQLLDSLLADGSSVEEYGCKHGWTIQFWRK